MIKGIQKKLKFNKTDTIGYGRKHISVSRRKYLLACLLCSLFIIFSHLYCINIRLLPSFLDEFGYWGNAAVMAGYDWSSFLSGGSYFAYGYSLLLTVIMRLIPEPLLQMKAALILNLMLLLVFFYLLLLLGKKLWKTDAKYLQLGTACVITLYPALSFSVATAWSEMFNNVYYLLILLLVFNILSHTRLRDLFLLIGLSAFGYYLHHRFLGILAAVVMLTGYLVYAKKVKLRWGMALAVCLGILLLIFSSVDQYIIGQSVLERTADTYAVGKVSSHVGKISSFFSVQGIIQLLKNICGRLYGLNCSMLLLLFPSLCYLISQIMKGRTGKAKFGIYPLFYMFMVTVFLFITIIAVLFMLHPQRIDQVIYARYIEPTAYPILFIGIVAILSGKVRVQEHLFCIGLHLITALITGAFLQQLALRKYFITSTPGIYKLYRDIFAEPDGGCQYIYAIAIALSSLMLLFVLLRHVIKSDAHYGMAILVICGFLWFDFGRFAVIYQYSDRKAEQEAGLLKLRDELEACKDEIYIVTDNKTETCMNSYAPDFQFLFPRKKFSVIAPAELKNVEKGSYILIDRKNTSDSNFAGLKLIEEDIFFYLLAAPD